MNADYDAGSAQLFGELAYQAKAGALSIEPFANLAYVNLHTDGFTEQGGTAALAVAGSTTDTTLTTLGTRLSTDFMVGDFSATGHGMIGWRHAYGDVPASAAAFAGGDAFPVQGVPLAEDVALVEAGIDMKLSPNASLGLAYAGQFGSGAHENGFNANLAVKF